MVLAIVMMTMVDDYGDRVTNAFALSFRSGTVETYGVIDCSDLA